MNRQYTQLNIVMYIVRICIESEIYFIGMVADTNLLFQTLPDGF